MHPKKRGFGQLRRLPSKRWQAFYTGPDTVLHYAPSTFETKLDAEAWLADERRLIAAGDWVAPKLRAILAASTAPTLFGAYAESWLEHRRGPKGRELKPRTKAHYRDLLDRWLLPDFGELPLVAITPPMVDAWHARLGKRTGPTYQAHAYALLSTIFRTAVAAEVDKLKATPCRIRGAAHADRAVKIEPATLDQLATATAAMPEPYRAMVLLASWCGLRFGELAELRRKDVDLKTGVIHVRRAVVRVDGQTIVGTPKSEAGDRDVAIPPHLLPVLRAHVTDHAAWGRDGLLFPASDGAHLPSSSLYWHWHKARAVAGRPDLRWHDLRHTGAVLAAQTGATLAELMARLGHSTPAAALRYQHAAQGRDAQIAAALSKLAEGGTS